MNEPTLADQIMNLPTPSHKGRHFSMVSLAYESGHRDARHAAAELATTALDERERENERLRRELAFTKDALAGAKLMLRQDINAALSNEVNDENVCH